MSPWYHGFSPSSSLYATMSPTSFSAEGSCCKSISCFFDLSKSPKSLLSLPFWCELSYKILAVLFPLCNSWLLKFERTLFFHCIKRLLTFAISVAGSNALDFFLVTANFSVNVILKYYF